MRRFSSYGPTNPKIHYYAPRESLVNKTYTNLIGESPDEGGHYITVWAPRQTGKTWLMQQILFKLQQDPRFEVLVVSLESLKDESDVPVIIDRIAKEIGEELGKTFEGVDTQAKFQDIFKRESMARSTTAAHDAAKRYSSQKKPSHENKISTNNSIEKPLILILDEFDALDEQAINTLVSTFRNIYMSRMYESEKPANQNKYLLHGVALIGVRSVLGVENIKGSPFNVQRSIHVPNLTFEEVDGMFKWYEKESGQKVEQEVIEKLYYETNGQPGLTCWFGELLTETYNREKDRPITMDNFEEVYAAATYALPNNNILNIISKVKQPPYREWILDLFKTGEKIGFRFDDVETAYLYMNGVIDMEQVGRTDYYVRFASPFVQKRLFNYLANELFDYLGQLVEPFEKLDDVFAGPGLHVPNLLKCYNRYLTKNRDWLLKEAPRRKDLRIYEAVFHFNLYMYLAEFLKSKGGRVYPEFPTGNGKIDLVVKFEDRVYGLELKSFSHETAYKKALQQAAKYGKQLQLPEMYLVFFVEAIDETSRQKYEKNCPDKETGVTGQTHLHRNRHAARPATRAGF